MDALNFQWYSERTQSREELIELMQAQVAALERKVDAFKRQSIQNSYNQQKNNYTPNYYHPDWQDHSNYSWNNQDQFYAPSILYPHPQQHEQKSNLEKILDRFLEPTEMRMNNQEFFAPELSYPSEFSYQPQSYEVLYQQPPPQQEKKLNLEEILVRFLESTEISITNNEESVRNLEIQREQLADVINNLPQETLPIDIEIDPKEEGKELCEANTLESGKEVQEAVRKNLKRPHSDEEEDCEVGYKSSKLWEEEKNDEDDQAFDLNWIKHISLMSIVQQFHNSEEYIQVDLGEGKDINLDEFKFGGGRQFCEDAKQSKEKTKRRHDKTIFAIEPD